MWTEWCCCAPPHNAWAGICAVTSEASVYYKSTTTAAHTTTVILNPAGLNPQQASVTVTNWLNPPDAESVVFHNRKDSFLMINPQNGKLFCVSSHSAGRILIHWNFCYGGWRSAFKEHWLTFCLQWGHFNGNYLFPLRTMPSIETPRNVLKLGLIILLLTLLYFILLLVNILNV